MGVGNYLLETPGSDLELNVLKEIESTLHKAARSISLPDKISSDTIVELYNQVSVIAMMLNRWDIDNLPRRVMETGWAFLNIAHPLSFLIPIVIFNSDLMI